jgi:hypothetical protein
VGATGIEGRAGEGEGEGEGEEGEVVKLASCYPSTYKTRCLIPIISINIKIGNNTKYVNITTTFSNLKAERRPSSKTFYISSKRKTTNRIFVYRI